MRAIWFILKLPLKILMAPVILSLTLFVWICVGIVYVSGLVLAYVLHDWGGAATTLRCAKQKKKQIISYRDEMGS